MAPQNAYTKAQEGTRKDIERIFVVLQIRFGIIRLESKLWCIEDIVIVFEACVILHNILVPMHQSGALDEEISEGEEQLDMISQFIDDDTTWLLERRVEHPGDADAVGRAAKWRELRQGAHFSILVDQMRVPQALVTDLVEHVAMRNELIDMFAMSRASTGR